MRRGALEARQLRSPGYKRAGTVSRSTGRPVKCDAGCGGQVTGVARGRSSTYARHDKVRRRTYGVPPHDGEGGRWRPAYSDVFYATGDLRERDDGRWRHELVARDYSPAAFTGTSC